MIKKAVTVLILAQALSAGTAHCQNASSRTWKNTAEFSLVSANGNSKTATTAAKDTFVYFWRQITFRVIVAGLGTESSGKMTAEQYNASEKVLHNFGGKNYICEKVLWERDRFAGFWNRYELTVALGREVISLQKDKLIVEFGSSYIDEERISDPHKDFASSRIYWEFTHKVSATSQFSQDFKYLTNFREFKDYRIYAETALTAAISTRFSLKTSFLWKRTNRPPRGFLKDDTTTMASIVMKF
ncbi:MAG: DUF481 domain-containing protein [bacterium]